jgi:hypothetical protein
VGYFALVEGFLFVAILFLGLVYVWAKGDLDWVLAYEGNRYQPKFADSRLGRVAKVRDIESELEAREKAAKAAAQPEPNAV